MATKAEVVTTYGQMQRRAVVQTSATVQRLWQELSGADLDGSWTQGLGMAVTRAVAAGQLVAASSGQAYVDAVVSAGGESSNYAPGATAVVTRGFSGTASDGRDLATLLYEPIIRTKTLIKGGMTLQESMLGGLVSMQRIVDSEIADAGRGAVSVAMAGNRTVTGFVRCVRAGACARCVILAGRWYRYNADFQRHARCQCYGQPATEGHPGRRLGVSNFFNGLSRSEQNRRFGTGGAQAIREGADMNQVVNAQRGVSTMGSWVDEQGFTHRGSLVRTDVGGREVVVTRTGTSKHGAYPRAGTQAARLRPPRITPAEIYKMTEDREQLIGLLRKFGYLR